jgi:hypothetical protein
MEGSVLEPGTVTVMTFISNMSYDRTLINVILTILGRIPAPFAYAPQTSDTLANSWAALSTWYGRLRCVIIYCEALCFQFDHLVSQWSTKF